MDDASAPSTIRISSTSGRLRIDARPAAEVAVSKAVPQARTGDVVTIDTDHESVDVIVPEGSDLVIGSVSGAIRIRGRLGEVAIVSRSGKIELDHAVDADIRSETGRIQVGTVERECRAHSTTGRVDVGTCGRADVSSTSGRVQVDRVDGPAAAHSVSGRVSIAVSRAADIEAETVTGRIAVAFPPGVRVHRADAVVPPDQRPVDSDCTVVARSGTGSVNVTSQ